MRLGVDLGGTKIEAAVLGPDGAVRARARVPTPRGYAPVIAAIAALVARVEAIGGAAPAVGVGIPGSLSPLTGLVRNANSTQLNGHPLDRDLAAALGRPVRFDNDANCFALAEARAGAGRGADVVFGVILGTGTGGGVVIGGQARIGANGVAGEWGHNPLPHPRDDERPGPACYCGRTGCIEAWLSGPSLARDHARVAAANAAAARAPTVPAAALAAAAALHAPALAARHDAPAAAAWGAPASALPPPAPAALDAPAIAAGAAGGDAACVATLARHHDRLARALATIVNVLDPDVIVLGGGLSNLPHLAETLPPAVAAYAFSDCFRTPIRRHALGDSAGVIGAAWLWPEEDPA